MRRVSWRVVATAGLVLLLGCDREQRQRPSTLVAGGASAAASGSGATSSASGEQELIDAMMAAKARAAPPVSTHPARWPQPYGVTTHAGRSLRPGRDPIRALALGTGWGCADFGSPRAHHTACWLSASVAARDRGNRAVVAERLRWLEVWPVMTAERWCARGGPEAACAAAIALIASPPADIPEPQAWRRAEDPLHPYRAVAAAPGFSCTLDEGALVCRGSDPFGVPADGAVKLREMDEWSYPFALGHHHGCVRQGLAVECWGRGDHGELGFAPSESCKDGAREVACSRRPQLVRAQGEPNSHPPLLVAGDTFTCSVTANFVECWGTSRDGFFSAPGPVRVPGLRLNGAASLSAGPRGLCGDDYDHGARCVGAIPSPPRGVTSVVVSQGDDGSACGQREDGIVCWGEDYSPPDRPNLPVRISVGGRPDRAAPVVDARGGRWDIDCKIKSSCTRDWTAPPPCADTREAVPWSMLARNAGALRGKVVTVMGNFVVGPGSMTLMGCSRYGPHDVVSPNPPQACCNQRQSPLGLVSDGLALRLERLECEGDESRMCCSASATGQAIVAKGVLDSVPAHGDAGWLLREPQLCSLE